MSTPRLSAIPNYLYAIPYEDNHRWARSVTAGRDSPSYQAHLADAREADHGAGGGRARVGALESQRHSARAGPPEDVRLRCDKQNRSAPRHDERQPTIVAADDAIDDVEVLAVVVAHECADVGSSGNRISRTGRARLSRSGGDRDLSRTHLVGQVHFRDRVRQRTGIDRAEVARHQHAEM